jgi:hypothetical protein
MSYTKQTWNNDSVGGTPISATRLNNIEAGIFNADFQTCTSTTRPSTGLFDGMRIFETDTKAWGIYDATLTKWVMFDTQWQSWAVNLTLGATAATTDLGTGIVIGNGGLAGRFFRTGRKIDLQGYFAVGSTTNYSGKNGYILVDYPTGYRPASAISVFGANSVGGPARMNGGSGISAGWCINRYDATSTNRRMWFVVSANENVVGAGISTANNITASGHWLNWSNTYETAFES